VTAPPPDWAATLRALADGATRLLTGIAGEDAGADHPGAECRSCPVCTALAVLRGRRPDLSVALADVLTAAAAALREQAGTPEPTDPPEETVPATPPPPAPVQHVEVA